MRSKAGVSSFCGCRSLHRNDRDGLTLQLALADEMLVAVAEEWRQRRKTGEEVTMSARRALRLWCRLLLTGCMIAA